MMQFPITDLLDEQECHDYLLRTLHLNDLKCPTCGYPLPPSQAPHDRSRDPIFDYRCRVCGAVFNLFSKTIWSGTHYNCKTIVLVMRGFAQGIPTLHLAQELNLDYKMTEKLYLNLNLGEKTKTQNVAQVGIKYLL